MPRHPLNVFDGSDQIEADRTERLDPPIATVIAGTVINDHIIRCRGGEAWSTGVTAPVGRRI